MAKVYQLPIVSSELSKRITEAGFKLERKSKDCVKLMPMDEVMMQYKRYYVFHIDFEAGIVDGMNISEHVPGYKRATIWVKKDELQLLLDLEKELTKLLEIGEFLP